MERLVIMANLEPTDLAAAMEYRDKEGNTLLHRAVMAKDAPDILQVHIIDTFLYILISRSHG